MAFRGVGDQAIEVISDQERLKMQARQLNEQARQADMSTALRGRELREGARQFDVGMAERSRQFDTGVELDRAKMAEQTRQFEHGAALDRFKSALSANLAQSELEQSDAETQLKRATLRQYMAAADEEDMQRANRETMAKSAFSGFFLSAMHNGGTAPAAAVRLLQESVGDKENVVVGGYVDPASGIGVMQVRGPDGTVTERRMSPGTMYGMIESTLGGKTAEAFKAFYIGNAGVTAAIDKEMARAAFEREKRAIPTASDMIRGGSALVGQAARELKAFDTDPANLRVKSLIGPDGKALKPKDQPAVDAYLEKRAGIARLAAEGRRMIQDAASGARPAAAPEGQGEASEAAAPSVTTLSAEEMAAFAEGGRSVPQNHRVVTEPDGTRTLVYLDPATMEYVQERL